MGRVPPDEVLRPIRDAALAAAVCAALTAIAYPNVIFGGQTLVASANYPTFDDRYERLRPGGPPFIAYLNWHDVVATWTQWDPASASFSRAFRAGQLPLWDPSNAGGVDAHVNVTQGQYFPPYAAVLLAGNAPALRDAYCLALLFSAGTCAFLLARGRGLHPLACAVAAAAVLLGGTMTLCASSIIGQAAAVVPLVLLAVERYLAAPSAPRAAVLALAVALSALASFMPITVCGLMLVGIRLAVHAAGGGPRGWRAQATESAGAAGATALGLAGAAFLLLPLHLASRADPVFSRWYAFAARAAYPLETWPQFFSRVLPFNVTQGYSPYLASRPEVGPAAAFDFGVVAFLAALLASAAGPATRGLLWFLVAGAAVFTAKLFALPPVEWISWLPVIRHIHFRPYGGAALGLCVALLAALGADALVRGRASVRRAAAVAAVYALLVAYAAWFAATHALQPGSGLRDPGAEAARLAACGAAVAAVAWLRAKGKLGGSAAGSLVLAALLVELVPLARTPRFRRADVWNDVPPYVSFLQADPARFRIHSTDILSLSANINQGVGVEALSSRHAFNSPRYVRLLRSYFQVWAKGQFYPLLTDLVPRSRVLLDLLNVRYLVLRDPPASEVAGLEAMQLEVAFRDVRYVVMRNRSEWPRSYVARAVLVAPTTDEAVAAVGHLRPREVVLEETPRRAAVGRSRRAGDPGESQIRAYEPERVVVDVVAEEPAVVVLADAHMPGWSATVNGEPAAILHANVAFRGVEVPAGRSEVEFRYRTPGLDAGLALSGLALAAIAGLAAWPVVRRTGRGDAPPRPTLD